MERLKSIIYISKSTKEVTHPLLDSILQTSRLNNRRTGITGMLVVRHGRFLQLLEGSKEAVELLFDKIRNDPRHRQVQVLGACETSERITPAWDMALVAAESNPESTEQILSLFELGNSGQPYQSPESLRTLLRVFSRDAKLLDPADFSE